MVVPPFETSGIDCCGPFPVRHGGRGTAKRWILLVTCFVTRGVALFSLKDMTASTFINALFKLQSQYPSVKKLYCDKGSNFVGADREIREAVEKWGKSHSKIVWGTKE